MHVGRTSGLGRGPPQNLLRRLDPAGEVPSVFGKLDATCLGKEMHIHCLRIHHPRGRIWPEPRIWEKTLAAEHCGWWAYAMKFIGMGKILGFDSLDNLTDTELRIFVAKPKVTPLLPGN